MENPRTWTRAHLVIDSALTQHQKDLDAGTVGGSPAHAVYEALCREGLLSADESSGG